MRALNLDERLYSYLLEHSLREHPVQRELREATLKMPMAECRSRRSRAS